MLWLNHVMCKLSLHLYLFPCKHISDTPLEIKTVCLNFKDHRTAQRTPEQWEDGVNTPLKIPPEMLPDTPWSAFEVSEPAVRFDLQRGGASDVNSQGKKLLPIVIKTCVQPSSKLTTTLQPGTKLSISYRRHISPPFFTLYAYRTVYNCTYSVGFWSPATPFTTPPTLWYCLQYPHPEPNFDINMS